MAARSPSKAAPLGTVRTPLYPIQKMAGKSASFTQGKAPDSKRNTLNAAISDGSATAA